MTVSRLITDLHPDVQPMVRKALAACADAGLDVLITCTFRSPQAQAELYAIGRTKPGRKVTNAKAGQSTHNFRLHGMPASLAVDVVPMRHGKPVWGLAGNGIDDDASDDDRDDLELWQRVRLHFEATGMKSASRWQGAMREWPHFQHPRAYQIMEGELNA